MDRQDDEFFARVIEVVARHGMKRTTMAHLARELGLSRQTLYDRFGDKDGVMAAVIGHMAGRLRADLDAAFAAPAPLADKIDAYVALAVWPTYDLIRSLPDAADFERGMGPESRAATAETSLLKRRMLAGMLQAHLPSGGPAPDQVAAFIEQAASRAKMSGIARDEMARFLDTLRASVLALARRDIDG